MNGVPLKAHFNITTTGGFQNTEAIPAFSWSPRNH